MTHRSRLPVDPTRVCLDCAGPVSGQSKSGRCRRCSTLRLNQDREVRAKAGRTLSKTYATNAAVRERHAAGCARGAARRKADPVQREKLRAAGRRVSALGYIADRTTEQRDRDVRAQVRAATPWCPEEHWELNRMLKRKGLTLAERKRAILELVPGTAEHAAREVASRHLANRIHHERDRAQSY